MDEKIHDMFYGASPFIHKKARELRKRETKAEKILWSFLSNHQLKVKFRRQHPISSFIVDFYCHELKLAVEADGEIHEKEGQKAHDQARDEHLRSLGLLIIRFKNPEIIENTEQVLQSLQKIIEETKNRKASPL